MLNIALEIMLMSLILLFSEAAHASCDALKGVGFALVRSKWVI
jgi:hypothetical protein